MKKRRTHDWELKIAVKLRKMGLPEEKITQFMPYLWKKKQEWDLSLMREMVGRRYVSPIL